MKTTNARFTRLIAGSLLLAGSLASCQKEDVGMQPVNADSPAMEDDTQDARVTKNVKGLTILIDYSDAPGTVPVSRVDNLMNGIGYTEATVPSSVRDYWYTQSRGKVNLTHDVQGYFRAPHPASWYIEREQEWWQFVKLSKEALDWFKAKNPNYDWNSLSLSTDPNEKDEFLSINFVPSTATPGSGGTHNLSGITDDFVAPNGKRVAQITGQAIIDRSRGEGTRLFVTLHEMGHSLWSSPDTYDHTAPYAAGTGRYSVMSGDGSTEKGEVESFGAPFVVKQGWVRPIDMQPNQSYTLTQDGGTMARYVNPADPKEYFLIEARKQSTLGNGMNPFKKGLLIWHVDENMENNDDSSMTPTNHYQYAIEQADGRFDLERGADTNKGDAGDYYVPGKVFSNSSIPNSKWWNGNSSGLNINNIKLLQYNRISFCNGNCPD